MALIQLSQYGVQWQISKQLGTSRSAK